MLNIIQVPNTSIGKQMSINPEIYRGKYFYEMVKLTSKEIGYEFEYEEYKGGLNPPIYFTDREVANIINQLDGKAELGFTIS